MYFNKCHQPENFAFPERRQPAKDRFQIGKDQFRIRWQHLGESVHRLDITNRRWAPQHSQAELEPKAFDRSQPSEATFDNRNGITLNAPNGKPLLASYPGRSFGVSGQAWIMQFSFDPRMRFYGMGEKTLGLELSEKHTKFWNTDVWADFNMAQVVHGSPDPMYLSIPYMIVQQGGNYAGILVNNPYAVFMSTNPRVRIADQNDADAEADDTRFFIGSPDGVPEVYFLTGPTLPELTRKLQRLVGTTPTPPLWSLGHHQCRWGYASYKDLDHLDQNFRKHKIPNDGLWLDIDYMRGYRVFTFNSKHWPKAEKQIRNIHDRGQRVVPILDPGVKRDPDYDVYQSGKKHDIFCHNPAGGEYVGFVWPGTTVFPDYSIPQARDWWSNWVDKATAGLGIEGAWIDMNDPSTGLSENGEMLFNQGKIEHAAYHNQYALGMAKATFDGFLANRPDQRPFILTRSGFTSINRYAAAWTGDNFSNWHHLKTAIPTSLNLALSGLPFNGPDVPGFGGDATPELAVAWYKAGCLFPVLRNHTVKGTKDQEPWAFGGKTLRTIRRYIRLRYKLLPYLYNLFVEHEQTGEAILRPLFYDHRSTRSLPLDRIDDQFSIGPTIMQAPLLNENQTSRQVVLPAGNWFDAQTGKWLKGNRRLTTKPQPEATPLYIRDGAIIPVRPGQPRDNHTPLNEIELHLFFSPKNTKSATYTYHADDGLSYAYRDGKRTSLTFTVRQKNGRSHIQATPQATGFGPIRVRFIWYTKARQITLSTAGSTTQTQTIDLKPTSWDMLGSKLQASQSPFISIT
ncbi:TIM-barrel domain-containing protein [Mucisphaera sp.]|uniref:glycoside hydrolase family 31 protein n=1 Tax=Mucisphaera sp. TaxID=2913024 RepID=UPI003D149C1C